MKYKAMSKVIAHVANNYTKLNTDAETKATLRSYLRVLRPGAWFSPKYKSGVWDGRISLLERDGSIATGLLGIVTDFCKEQNTAVEVIDNRQHPEQLTDFQYSLIDIEDRDEQIKIADDVIKAGRAVIQMGTGGGKTEVAIRVACQLKVPTLFLVHLNEIFEQTYDRFVERTGLPIGRIGADYKEFDQPVTVAMVQTLQKAVQVLTKKQTKKWSDERRQRWRDERKVIKKFLGGIGLLILDEAHHYTGEWYKLAMLCSNAFYRVGMSAAILKADNEIQALRLTGATGDVVANVSVQELQELGRLSPAAWYLHDLPKQPKDKTIDYQAAYDRLVINHSIRNNIIVEVCKANQEQGKTTLVLICRKEHGWLLESLMKQAGIKVAFLHGSVSKAKRRQGRKQFASGELSTVVATQIFDEGVDIPSMNAIVLAGAGKDELKVIQRIGRALRKFEGKSQAEIHDFCDSGKYLTTHTRARREVLERELGIEPEVVLLQSSNRLFITL